MLGNGIGPETTLKHGVGSPQRPRHHASKSITELSSPTRTQHRHHQHHHSHHHIHRHNGSFGGNTSINGSSSGSGRPEEGSNTAAVTIATAAAAAAHPQSAVATSHQQTNHPQARPSFELSAVARSEAATPNLTPNPSRRPSILAAAGPGDDVPFRPAAPPPPGPAVAAAERRPTREEDPAVERAKGQATAMGLKTAVTDLSTTSTATARRLDEAYASVTDKLASLGGTVSALEELRRAWHEAAEGFSRETEELLAEVGAQVEGLGTFEAQRSKIESLQARIHDGRERIQRLSGRVDAVRERIEGWERADREWQERTRRRLRAVWVATSVVVLVLVVFLIVAAGHSPEEDGGSAGSSGGGGGGGGGVNVLQAEAAKAGSAAAAASEALRSAVFGGGDVRVPSNVGRGGGAASPPGDDHGELSHGARLFKSLNQSGRNSRSAADAEQRLRVLDEL